MTRLFPLILPDKPSPYGPATKNGDDEADDVEADSETTDSEDEDND